MDWFRLSMKDEHSAEKIVSREELHDFCLRVHRQTGIFLRISTAEDFRSLASLVRLSCSPRLAADFQRLQLPH